MEKLAGYSILILVFLIFFSGGVWFIHEGDKYLTGYKLMHSIIQMAKIIIFMVLTFAVAFGLLSLIGYAINLIR